MNAPAPVSKSAPGSRLRRAAPAEAGAARAAAASKTTKAAIRVLIVDDSLTVRTIFKRMVESDGAMNVVETSSSAERAIAQLDKTGVDVVLLDLEMPGMGGLEALPTILERARGGQVLVVSSLTQDGAEHTISALSMGAADTMLKPRPGGFNEDYRSQLLGKIRALGENQPGGDPGEQVGEQADEAPLVSQQSDKGTGTGTQPLAAKPHAAQLKQAERADTPSATALRPVPKTSPEVIAIGASTGGIHALNILLRCLTPDFDLPILITQHLPASFIPVFARQVEMACARPAIIAAEGAEIRRGQVAIATGHGHMIVRRVGDRLIAKASTEPARSGCLPSVDPMFESLASACEGRVLGVVLSGMGRDGLHGAQKLVDAGGAIFTQNAETSAVWGMPGAVTKAGLSSLVGSPGELGARVLELGQSVTTPEPN